MGTYIIVTFVVTSIILTLYLIKTKPKEKSVMDELKANPKFKELQEMYKLLHDLNKNGTEMDTIPDGYGEFGYDLTNPIPVNTILGNTAYLAKLRTLDGVKVTYNRVGSFHSSISTNPIDGYKIFANEKEIATLYIDPYNKKNSNRAPKNFKLISFT
jgi:hypothetical protein